MTVAEMMDRMSSEELTEWIALDSIRAQEQQRAQRMADKGMSMNRGW